MDESSTSGHGIIEKIERGYVRRDFKTLSPRTQKKADLTLGQPLSTLSGGECQRIKLASELHKKGSVYVLDEPTTGLHMSDVAHLLAILDRLVEGGNSVIVIEHNMDVVRRADWVIDLGPERGSKGGRVLVEGTPASLLQASQSLTSRYLHPSGREWPVTFFLFSSS